MNKEDLDVANVSINELLENVTRLEVIDHTKGKCPQCYGSGKVRIEGQTEPFECPNCHGSRMAVPGREVLFHGQDKEVMISLQDEGKTLKIFIGER